MKMQISEIYRIVCFTASFDFQESHPRTGINRPNGSDVYHGVPKDYTGEVRQSAGSEPAGSASFQ